MSECNWTRRSALALGAAAGACAPLMRMDAGTPSLNALARAKGMRFGAAIGRRDLDDRRLCEVVRRECGLVVAENDHKWPYIHPARNVYSFAPGDRLVRFAERNGMAVRGHNLLWQHPRWLAQWVTDYDFGADARTSAEALLREHITTVCQHYGTRIGSWDVVNETIDERTGDLRDTVLTRAMGSDVVAFCFHVAREAAPDAQLVYNDFMGWSADSATHRAGVLRLLHDLRTRGAPVDALGLQSHIGSSRGTPQGSFNAPQEREWRQFLDEVVGMGFALLITEFDVNDRTITGDIAARDRAVADYAKAYLDITLSYPQLKDVLTWGVVNHRSWLQRFTPREDGLPLRPLPFDDFYRSTPLRAAIAAAFEAAPAR
ncbi:MAG TPA: endo-1,4-beta-xylanase [Caulobacterales bacterium]|nr:endo-1,4-beta-xylanase [Caulobacterales bacterium]